MIGGVLQSALEAAFAELRGNLFRSALTVLGVVVGVTAVLMIGAIGQGLRDMIREQLERQDPSLLIVVPQTQDPSGRMLSQRGSLRERDLTLIAARMPNLRASGANLSLAVRLSHGNVTSTTALSGVNPDMHRLLGREIATGRNLTQADFRLGPKVALLGSQTASKLFGDTPAVGQLVLANGVLLTVIGVLAQSGANFAGDQDDLVVVPLATARKRIIGRRFGTSFDSVSSFWLTFANGTTQANKLALERHLKSIYQISSAEAPTFSVRSMEEQYRQVGRAVSILSLGLTVIASVSLFVAGIGIMNIMLVSVSERTTEIGLRMALGATRSDIRNQFLIEAVVICSVGALIGILLSILFIIILRAQLADWPLSILPSSIVGAVGLAIVTGAFFGVVPAIRASRLDPSVAMHSD